MENIPDDELISAYLDGELTGQDLARAEQLLASQPDSRQMLDELRALRASLKALPQQKLGPDFAESILRRAEREMLQPAATSGAAVIDAATMPERVDVWKSDGPPILSMSRWRRPLVWSALATAAAIAVMMFSPPDAERKVVMAPQAAPGPGAVQQTMQAADSPNKNSALVADSEPGGAPSTFAQNRGELQPMSGAGGGEPPAAATPDSVRGGQVASPYSAANGAFAGQASATVSTPAADGDGAPILVVLCDVTPEVARSAGFRRLLAEQQIPWQEAGGGANASDAMATFAASAKADSGKEQDGAALDKAKLSDQTADSKKDNVAATATKPAPERSQAASALADSPPVADPNRPDGTAKMARSSATKPAQSGDAQPNSEAVYVVATPSQVDATIAAIAGSADYRNVQTKELTGPLPVELQTAIRDNSDGASNFNAVQDSAATLESAASTDSDRGRSLQDKRNVPAIAASADPAAAPPPNAANAPGAAATVASPAALPAVAPLAIARPAVAHAAPTTLSSATIAELSRAVDSSAANDDVNGHVSESDEQSPSANESAKRPADKDPSQQQKLELGKSEPASDIKPEAAGGASQLRSSKSVKGGRKIDAPIGSEPVPAKAYNGAERPPKPTAAPTPATAPAPPTEPAADSIPPQAERAKSAGQSEAGENSAGAKVRPPAPMAGKTSNIEQRGSVIRGVKQGKPAEAADQASDPAQKQELAKGQEGVAPKRAIFLFRVVPAPVEAREP